MVKPYLARCEVVQALKEDEKKILIRNNVTVSPFSSIHIGNYCFFASDCIPGLSRRVNANLPTQATSFIKLVFYQINRHLSITI